MKKRPNIIIFNPDQMRADSLAHLGNPTAAYAVLQIYPVPHPPASAAAAFFIPTSAAG